MSEFNVKDFENLLKLDEDGSPHDFRTLFGNVYGFAEKVWEAPCLYTFVDHGIDHSYRVLKKAWQILELSIPDPHNKLSPLEKFIIGSASLIHDVGMQYNKYPKQSNPLSPEEIRKRHCQLGYEMVEDAMEPSKAKSRSMPELPVEYSLKEFIYYTQIVAFAHSGKENPYWCIQLAKEELYGPDKAIGDMPIRLQLLAAILRLADELDCDMRRVREINWLFPRPASYLTPRDVCHWASCFFVEQVDFSMPTGLPGTLFMTIQWRAPNEDDQRETIRKLLREYREKKIKEEIAFIKPYFRWAKDREAVLDANLSENPREMLWLGENTMMEVCEKIKEYFPIEKPSQSQAKQAPSSREPEIIACSHFEPLRKEAKDFEARNSLFGDHYRLKTGYHTDKYLDCRELVAKVEFTRELCYHLYDFYKDEKFTHILAIGTSASKIGSFLACLLDCKFTFTFGDIKIESDARGKTEYTEFEKEVIIPGNSRVLVIDDILAVGSVLKKVVNQLEEAGVQYIRVFCIYSLGEIKEEIKELLEERKYLKIDYLVGISEVKYWMEGVDNKCEYCRQNRAIRIYEE